MRRIAVPAIALTFLAGCEPGAVPLSDEDVASIRALAASYADAYTAMDADAVAATYTDDATEMPPDVPARAGRSAIRNSWAEEFGAVTDIGQLTMTPVEINGMDGLAYDRGTWSWTGIMPDMTEAITVTGNYLAIARHQEDGAWRYAEMIWNGDQPPPQPE
jgi:uncharacterized protein (TIGR02246 family)